MPTSNAEARTPEFTRVGIEFLQFDTRNPRFGGEGANLSQSEIQRLLFDPPHSASLLLDSFAKNGYISYEPLVVRREASDRYVVIEGNRRLSAVQHIVNHPNEYDASIVSSLKEIPVLVFHEKADASHLRDIRTYLGVRHLVGYREWPAESKAIFLDQNIKSRSDLKRLMQEFAIRKQDIVRYLVPYRVKKAARDLLEEYETAEDQAFWMLGEALSRTGVKEYIQLDVDSDSLKVRSFNSAKFQHLLEYLYGSTNEGRGSRKAVGMRRITETRQLTRLANVLASKKASHKLEEGSTLEEAEVYVESREDAVQSLTDDLRITLQKIIALKPTKTEIEKIAENFKSFEKAVSSFGKNA
jgi:hypothetical protein